ncbi:MAG: hypothetical protein HOE90_19160 [Bacteriovoracaceae bacterium]|jgi:hypothetical protein|nr:hypothetical protein [Bacteriovoracaceae bacterium]
MINTIKDKLRAPIELTSKYGANKFVKLFIVSMLTLTLFIRAVLFANDHGAVEHDSGWYIGTAWNLANNYKYASLISTSYKPGVGASRSIHTRPIVQDKEGHNYFSAGVTVGPGYIIPQAILFFIFGDGPWVNRAWPLMGYLLLVFFSLATVYYLGNWLSLLAFFLFLYSTPRFSIQFAFEAFSEHIAVLFGLLAFIVFHINTFQNKRDYQKKWVYLVSGMLVSMSYLTKMLGLFIVPAFLTPFFMQMYQSDNKKETLKLWFIWGFGILIPIIAYEAYRFLILTIKFGFSAWQASNEEIKSVLNSGGSGVSNLKNMSLEIFVGRWKVWKYAGIYESSAFGILFILCLIGIIYFSKKKDRLINYHFITMGLPLVIWFCSLSKTGWFRHIWIGAWFVVMTLAIGWGYLSERQREFSLKLWVFTIFTQGIYFSYVIFSTNPYFDMKYRLGASVVENWNNTRGYAGLPSVTLFDQKEQNEYVDWIVKNVKPEDTLFFDGWMLVAEIPPLIKRTTHCFSKYKEMRPTMKGKSYLMFGPYQLKSPIRIKDDKYVNTIKEAVCSKTVFKNPSYHLCEVDPEKHK